MLYEIAEKAARLENEGKKIIKFNIGDPDHPTPREIVEAACEAMIRGKTKYSSSAGEKTLREALASIHGVSEDNVVITAGSKWGIFAAMYLLLRKGGNVIVPTPYWTAYDLIAKTLGAEVRLVRTELESNWEIDVEKLEALIDNETRVIVLNNPHNPTCKVISEKTAREIVQIAEKHDVTVLSDEVYADISFVQTKSILDISNDNIVVKSFSKTFAMTGWRVGYVIAKKELIDKIVKLNQITLTNIPVFIQEAALKALELRHQIIQKVREEYLKRAELACKILSETNLKFSKPEAPFYLFPKLEGLDSEEFAFKLLERGVAITPGTAFGDYKEHFRLSLTAPDADIEMGLRIIAEALK
ncbi:MAG: pyridoxal phosphate-dependent aminotransferase [Nitrososphaerota archaeon]|nr:pyridoxal phosphate-dependent aminotransferase [Candidatus Bathyarchaeota archaeon]MDW8022296.1 pyridoxal phosphate-dependent aminotransferase [Nitrososphaerota archaeon]